MTNGLSSYQANLNSSFTDVMLNKLKLMGYKLRQIHAQTWENTTSSPKLSQNHFPKYTITSYQATYFRFAACMP